MDAVMRRLLREDFEALAKERRFPRQVWRAKELISRCRTAALGGHVQRCPHGHVERVWYNSCRHRSCPECAWTSVERWLDAQRARLLACEHFHVVFTLPHELHELWQWNERLMAGLLFRLGWAVLTELLEDERYLGATPGMVATLHTWGRTLTLHPHVHCLVTGGGVDEVGRWRAVRNGFLLPARVVCALFRGKYLAGLSTAYAQGALELPSGMEGCGFDRLVNRLGRKKWNVRVKERYADGEGVAKYLGRYVRGGPISQRRIEALSERTVTFRYRDHRDGKTKRMTLSRAEFLRRWLMHVPPVGLHVVRSYGLYRGHCEAKRAAARAELGQTAELEPTRVPAKELLERRGFAGIVCCPTCGVSLVLARVLAAARGPPERSSPPGMEAG